MFAGTIIDRPSSGFQRFHADGAVHVRELTLKALGKSRVSSLTWLGRRWMCRCWGFAPQLTLLFLSQLGNPRGEDINALYPPAHPKGVFLGVPTDPRPFDEFRAGAGGGPPLDSPLQIGPGERHATELRPSTHRRTNAESRAECPNRTQNASEARSRVGGVTRSLDNSRGA